MTGMLTLGDLKTEADAGRIDTVVVAMTDMAGQLIGKRFHARKNVHRPDNRECHI